MGGGSPRPGPGTRSSSRTRPSSTGSGPSTRTRRSQASGEAVGLPHGQMGNSEVGHLTIGSGRVLFQDLMRVNKSIEDGSFFENPALVGAFERGENVHLLGLVSYGGVHSHMDHLKALLRFAPEKTWIHAFTDGRDVSPHSAVRDLAELPTDRIATVVGRYYAMDRDQRWDRTDKALAAIARRATATQGSDPVQEVQRSYDAGVTDEFIEPIVLEGRPRLGQGRLGDLLQLPSRPGAAVDGAPPCLTIRRDDDDALPTRLRLSRRLRGAGGARDDGRGLRGARHPPAARRRDREVRARHLLLQRRPRGRVAGRDAHPRPVAERRPELRPQARDVSGAGRRRIRPGPGRRRLRLRGRQPGQSGHGRPHRLDPGRRQGGRGRRRRARPASSTPSSAKAGSPS